MSSIIGLYSLIMIVCPAESTKCYSEILDYNVTAEDCTLILPSPRRNMFVNYECVYQGEESRV